MVMFLLKPDGIFQWGYTSITAEGETSGNTMMDFGILRLETGKTYECSLPKERAFLLLSGNVIFHFNEEKREAKRKSLFVLSRVKYPRGGGTVWMFGGTRLGLGMFHSNLITIRPRAHVTE